MMDGGDVVMIEQHRYAVDRMTIEFPGGKLEPEETPLEAAHRELSGRDRIQGLTSMRQFFSFAPGGRVFF